VKYSIIIPYRNREEHLQILLPVLLEKFKNESFEIIVSEQNNNDNFQIACVQNIAYKYARGDILIFHQVDYVPSEDVSYEVIDAPVLPARVGIFLDKSNASLRDFSDIPSGYRRWSDQIDDGFYGGVICMKRHHFETINGFNPLYRGWGNEDEDLRERFVWANIPVHRNKIGTFYCLYHEDNGAMENAGIQQQKDFFEGRQYLLTQAYNDKHIGYTNLVAEVEESNSDIPNVLWLKSTNYNIIL
jgi:predicted glycosyltransferase involved in capsule biosynthesis